MSILEKVLYGLQVAGIGLVVVFTGLALLIFCIWVMSLFFRTKKKKEMPKAATAPAPAPVPVQETPAPVDEVVNDAELIAVIAAAIAAFDDSGKRLVVRKVRKVAGWNRSAREEQVYRF